MEFSSMWDYEKKLFRVKGRPQDPNPCFHAPVLKRDILFRNKRAGEEKVLKLRQDPIFHFKPLNLPKVQ